MLKTVFTHVFNPTSIGKYKIISPPARFLASFRNRDFQFETSDGEGSNSLITRLARHITIQNASTKDPIKYNIRYADYFPVSDIRRFLRDLKEISVEQLPQMVIFASIYKGRTEIPMIVDVVNSLDDEIAQKVDKMSQQQMIEMLNALMYFLPHKLVQLDFYQLAIRKLCEGEINDMTEFVTICFYLGMWKKNRVASELMSNLLKSYLGDYVNQLGTMDCVVVANAAFKTSTRINNKSFLERIVSEILAMKEPDLSVLLTFLKSCRHNKVKSVEILEKVRNWITSGCFDDTDIRAHAHILTYLAENRVSEWSLVSKLVTQACAQVNSGTRIKDISNLLWSCAHLGYDFKDETTMNRLANIIFGKLDDGEYRYATDDLIDTCLSMWMLGYKSRELADAALHDNKKGTRKNETRVKLDSRRILLTTLIDIDRKRPNTNAFKEDQPAPDFLISNRIGLQTTFKALEKLKQKFNQIKSVEYVQQINELNIAGILVTTHNEKVHVEVFDETNTLNDNKSPFGLMKLKQEILEQKACDVIRINVAAIRTQDEIEEITRQKMKDFLDGNGEVPDDGKSNSNPVSIKT